MNMKVVPDQKSSCVPQNWLLFSSRSVVSRCDKHLGVPVNQLMWQHEEAEGEQPDVSQVRLLVLVFPVQLKCNSVSFRLTMTEADGQRNGVRECPTVSTAGNRTSPPINLQLPCKTPRQIRLFASL